MRHQTPSWAAEIRGWMPSMTLLWTGAVAAIALALAHVAMGAGPLVVLVALSTVFLGVYAFARYGFLNIGGLLLFFVVFRYVGFPLLAKLVMGQPLDSHLIQPLDSFLVVLVGVLGYFLAYVSADRLRVGRPVLRPVVDARRLRHISFGAAAVGIVANAILAAFINEQSTTATVAAFLSPLLYLALIAGVAAALVESKGRRGLDVWVVLLVLLGVSFALVQNSRLALLETVLAYGMTVVIFRVKVTPRQWIALGAFLLVVALLFSPIMLTVRTSREGMSWLQRIEATANASIDWRGALAGYRQAREVQQQYGSYHLAYYGSPQNVLDRVSLVNHVDALKAGADETAMVGWEDLRLAVDRALPRVLSPDKPMGYGHGSWVYGKVGLQGAGPYATAPLIGNAYVAFGWAGAFVYPLVFGLLVLVLLKKIVGWNLHANIWAAYFLLRVHDTFVEGSIDAYLIWILRYLPLDLVVLLVLSGLSSAPFLVSRRRVSMGRPES